MQKIRIGILSTAKIGREKVIPAMQKSKYCEVTGICSRSHESAQRAAQQLHIPKAYGSYEELLDDTSIDAVYIPLPNQLHVQWSINALKAGKHVLCEKPIGMNTAEAKILADVSSQYPNLKIMEAFMYRYHPQWVEAKRLLRSGEIGQLITIQSFFSYYNDDPGNIRNIAETGGGGLMDIGCYNISLSRFLFDGEPDRVVGFMTRDPEFGTDNLFSGMMEFGGKISTFTCSTRLANYQRVNIMGTNGRIEILVPFNAPPDKPCQIILQRDDFLGDDALKTITFDVCDQYTLQADILARAILDDTPVPVPLSDAVDNMRVIEMLMSSVEARAWSNY